MKTKPFSQLFTYFGLIFAITLIISEEPGQGTIRPLGFTLSILLIITGIILGIIWKEQKLFRIITDWIDNHSALLKLILPLIIFVWPFLVFWQLILATPLTKTIGNDFINWYFTYKVELLANLCQFNIPFWSPKEASGFPFAASPLTQTFYPLNIPYALYSCAKGGASILSYQFFTILGISIFALGLYYWLKSLRGTTTTAFIVSLIIPISYKLIETARFPNAVHTAAWFPWLLLVLTRLFDTNNLRKAAVWTFCLLLFGFNIISAGYPYFVYYLIFLIPFYFLLLSVPKFRNQLVALNIQPQWKYIIGSLVTAGIGLLSITLPYLIQMASLLSQTTNRFGQNLDWASGIYSAGPKDFIGSAIFPPVAISEGWFYFGIFSSLLILLYMITSLRKENENTFQVFSPDLALFFLLWIGILIYLGWDNSDSPLHGLWIFLWKYFPGFNRLREWARINVILLPIIALILRRSLDYFFKLTEKPDLIRDSRFEILLSSLFALGILVFQIINTQAAKFTRYWDMMNSIDPDVYIILCALAIGLYWGTLVLASRGYFKDRERIPYLILIVLFCLLDARGGQLSPWIFIEETKTSAITDLYSDRFRAENFNTIPDHRVYTKRIAIPLSGQYNTWASRISWHFQRYVDFLDNTDDQLTERQILLGELDGQLLFFTRNIEYPDIGSFLSDDQIRNGATEVQIMKYSGDELLVEISNSDKGYLTFVDNWDPYWKADVNGVETPIILAFGTFKALPIKPGNNLVRFHYVPFDILK